MFNKKKSDDENPTQQTSTATTNSRPESRIKQLPSTQNPSTYPTKSPFPLAGTTENPTKEDKGSRLHVGRDIHLKGEITACDRLIVEGKVEASMNSNEIEISESGIFIGEVTIDTADISGEFKGSLIAKTKLIIRKTGKVSGDIQYGEIEIEPGGEISGNLGKTGQKQTELSLTEKVIGRTSKKTAAGPSAHH